VEVEGVKDTTHLLRHAIPQASKSKLIEKERESERESRHRCFEVEGLQKREGRRSDSMLKNLACFPACEFLFHSKQPEQPRECHSLGFTSGQI